METAIKFILVIGGLIALVILLPNILSFSATGIFGESQPAVSNLGTLSSVAAKGSAGLMAISFDGGQTFKSVEIVDGAPQNILVLTSRGGTDRVAFGGRVFYAGTDKGLLISRDNGLTWYSWSDLKRSIDAQTVIYDIEFDPLTNAIFVATAKNNFGVVWRTDDNFMTVRPVWTEPNMSAFSLAIHDGYLLIGLQDGRVLSYDPDFDTFVKLISFNAAVRRLDGTPSNELLAQLQNGDIYRSADPASSWTRVQSIGGGGTSLFPFFSSAPARPYGITFDRLSPEMFYLGARTGLYRSTNRGDQFALVNSILPNGAQIDALAAYGDELFVGSGSKLYTSNDAGTSWRILEPLPTSNRLSPIYVTGGGSIVVVGTRR